MALEAIRYKDGCLNIIDQLKLPDTTEFINISNVSDGWDAIKKMQVRGAPAIAIVGCLSFAVELRKLEFKSADELVSFVEGKLNYLVTARPTAVNMSDATNHLVNLCRKHLKNENCSVSELKNLILAEIEKMMEKDVAVNKAMGKYGGDHIIGMYNKPVSILTHCNTGSLATAGYGTALGVVRYLNDSKMLAEVFCTETRPYNQGARLTAYELVHEKMPATLVCDSMVSLLMQKREISGVIVGADRVVANGDTANKIGTYQIAIAAKHHNIPFFVAVPSTSIDLTLQTGDQIEIEERPAEEMTSVKGIRIAAPGINVWNPAFDVTPHELITGGIITEFGVFQPSELKDQLRKFI
ncbi:methylthioribose-1-phosphate isomerase-like [Tubulanus polymorphus]|uniref:methylthioribose-1-phosphate isomerase-like n=1 Tax=Tubulanus polymorphus TaxID=672921 RepID=UPI003DA1FC31